VKDEKDGKYRREAIQIQLFIRGKNNRGNNFQNVRQ